MRIVADPLHIAIDGNEANVSNRVGSNVYAYEVLVALEEKTRNDPTIAITVLLSAPPDISMPLERTGWKYKVVVPQKFWTQWALPLHLFRKRSVYDIFFTPGHYAPRVAPIPYVSSVMDTAFLDYPEQFTPRDRVQLANWTKYSVQGARKVIAISRYTRQNVITHYSKKENDVVVAYPASTKIKESLNTDEQLAFFGKHGITGPYILFVGTLQPRKNIQRLVAAYEVLRDELSTQQQPSISKDTRSKRKKEETKTPPKLVLAGKVGWMADSIVAKIRKSKYAADIITTGYISNLEKKLLLSKAESTVLIGLHEGFGIPPLEAMQYGSIPVVAASSSLPEVVGKAGFLVDPLNIDEIARTLRTVHLLSTKERAVYLRSGREQAAQFSWSRTADVILKTLLTIIDQTHYSA